ncbi:hypothetical protein SLS60_001194 [Paraconiothyrium brasiliense]|uniref:Protein kinase domain-containing protein n=1 Tax=Paraconiothyrium brasiliense TaxID=300254 RepID=A0ABR3S8Y4_9PLEO
MSGSNGRDRRRRISRKSLRSDIKAVMVLQDHADLQFVPASALSELFCKDTVARILDRHKDSFEEKLSSLEAFIYSKATIIFAILAWADSESLIEEFFQHNFADEQLPVRLVINEDLVDAISLRLGNTRIEEHPFNNAHWTDRNIEDFYSKEHPTVAVKRLKQMTMNDADFKAVAGSEVDALEAIRDLDHPHLVKAVAYYSIGKNHYIMFPWARWGNLRAFWEKESPRLDREFLQWVFAQMCGLAGAIKTLHHSHKERSLRHGDLKPENILCFDDPSKEADDKIGSCILVIADVGLSRSHEKVTELRNMATRTKSGTIKYEPPETELQPNEPRSRRYDVWSIGCIYLEFAIWILYGPEGLDHFREDLGALGETTRFYVIEQIQHSDKTRIPTARLNNVVQKWIDWIKKDARCQRPTAIRSLVDLIVERLLIVDVSAPSRIESRRLTFLDNEDSKSGTVPSFSLRAPTVDFTSANDPTHRARASAEEMDEKLKSIFEQATTSTRDQVEWINFNAPSQHGPKRYGDRLVASDAAERRNQQVRQLG